MYEEWYTGLLQGVEHLNQLSECSLVSSLARLTHLEFSLLVWPEEKFSPSLLQPGRALEDLQR